MVATGDLIINVALTGMIPTKQDNPHVPITEAEIIQDAIRCANAGASIFHIHARDSEGNPTPDPQVYARIIEGIRAECPEVILCVTTSGRNWHRFEQRAAVLDLDGKAKPDMASLTLSSLNFYQSPSINSPGMIMQLAEKMLEKQIQPELEVFDPGMINAAQYLLKKEYIKPPLYFNIILGSIYSTQANARDLAYLVDQLPAGSTWAAGGIGSCQLSVNTLAIVMGGQVRTGLEDNLWFDCEQHLPGTNEKYVRRLRELATILGRKIITPSEARKRVLGNSQPPA